MDYAVQLAGGYDCFPSVPDRYLGILQDVWVETTGPVVIRDPFVVTKLPLPCTDSATLKISTTLINASDKAISGILRGSITEAGLTDLGFNTYGWEGYIQPLDRGSFDIGKLLGTLKELGYQGLIGLQCYGIGGDAREHLARSLTAWQMLSRNLKD